MHLDPMTRSVLVRERAEQLREAMLAARRRKDRERHQPEPVVASDAGHPFGRQAAARRAVA